MSTIVPNAHPLVNMSYPEHQLSQYDIDSDYNDLNVMSLLNEQLHVDNPFNIPTVICGTLMSIVALVGLVGNLLTAYIFSRRTMGRASISVLLTGLAISDATLLIISAPLFASSAIYVHSPGFRLMTYIAYMTAYMYPVASALQTSSVWLMMVITIERYVAVCQPFMARTFCTRTRARRTVIIVLAMSILYNACRFWEYVPTPIDEENNIMIAMKAKLRENPTYILIYVHWMYFLFIFAIPFLVISVVSALVICAIRKARKNRRQLTRQQRKEHATASMMIVVASAYLACTSLAYVLNGMELWGASGGRDVELPQINLDHLIDGNYYENQTHLDQTEMLSLNHVIYSMPMDEDSDRKTARRHSNLFYFLIDLNNLLVMIHCSVNFLIYYKFSQRFRAHVRATVCRDKGVRQRILDMLTSDGVTTIEYNNNLTCHDELTKLICTRIDSKSSNAFETQFYLSHGRKLNMMEPMRRRAISMYSNGTVATKVSYPNLINSNSNYTSIHKSSVEVLIDNQNKEKLAVV